MTQDDAAFSRRKAKKSLPGSALFDDVGAEDKMLALRKSCAERLAEGALAGELQDDLSRLIAWGALLGIPMRAEIEAYRALCAALGWGKAPAKKKKQHAASETDQVASFRKRQQRA